MPSFRSDMQPPTQTKSQNGVLLAQNESQSSAASMDPVTQPRSIPFIMPAVIRPSGPPHHIEANAEDTAFFNSWSEDIGIREKSSAQGCAVASTASIDPNRDVVKNRGGGCQVQLSSAESQQSPLSGGGGGGGGGGATGPSLTVSVVDVSRNGVGGSARGGRQGPSLPRIVSSELLVAVCI